MQLKDEPMLSIGMMSMALGILIGRFIHFEYSGFSVSSFVECVLVGLSLVDESRLSDTTHKKVMNTSTLTFKRQLFNEL